MTNLGDSIWPEAFQTQQTYHAWLCLQASKNPDAVFDDFRGTTHSRCDGADRQSGIPIASEPTLDTPGSSNITGGFQQTHRLPHKALQPFDLLFRRSARGSAHQERAKA